MRVWLALLSFIETYSTKLILLCKPTYHFVLLYFVDGEHELSQKRKVYKLMKRKMLSTVSKTVGYVPMILAEKEVEWVKRTCSLLLYWSSNKSCFYIVVHLELSFTVNMSENPDESRQWTANLTRQKMKRRDWRNGKNMMTNSNPGFFLGYLILQWMWSMLSETWPSE